MDVIGQIVPDPDGQFRLRRCRCRHEDVRYLRVRAEDGSEPWVVRCFGCGATGAAKMIRHDAQIYWNHEMAEKPKRRNVS
ncbi:MAG: hypothetical protein IJW45_08405 [Oscillospiraceae bacterium]|nr:hypothetical protein [Oscillospiraceae bacterium]